MYADDLILVSNGVTDLQLLFTQCSEIFTALDLPINISKCSCMRTGPRCNAICSTLKIEQKDVQWVDSIKYLGVTICRAKDFKCNWDEAKRQFYRNANVIFKRLGTIVTPAVLLRLMYS